MVYDIIPFLAFVAVQLPPEPFSFLPSSSTSSYQNDVTQQISRLMIYSAICLCTGDEHVSRYIEMRDGDAHVLVL